MKILKKKCKKCGKEFTSLYEGQLKYNVMAHEITCKGEKKDEK
jgi:transposase-like protein